jgi:hypothetical protein
MAAVIGVDRRYVGVMMMELAVARREYSRSRRGLGSDVISPVLPP